MATVDKSHRSKEANRQHAERVRLQSVLARIGQRMAAVEKVLQKNTSELEEIKEALWEFRRHMASLHMYLDEISSSLRKGSG